MVNWDMTIADVVKKMKEDGYVLSEMSDSEKANAFFATITKAQDDVTEAEQNRKEQELLDAKREQYSTKLEEFMMRTRERAMEIAEGKGTWHMSELLVDVSTAYAEVKNEMVAEMNG